MSPPGCFVSGLYLEGADWDIEFGCLIKSKPKVLVVDLPILKIIPIEAHRLKLQVTVTSLTPLCLPSSQGRLKKLWGACFKLWGQFRGKILVYMHMAAHHPQGASPSLEPVVETQGNLLS